MERTVLQVEHRLCSKILTLEEQLAEHRMDRGVHTRLCSLEDGIKDIKRDMKVCVLTNVYFSKSFVIIYVQNHFLNRKLVLH